MTTINDKHPETFARAEKLIGANSQNALAKTNVIIFGVGGVGSWCAEGLVRSGVGAITIVDGDVVCPTNINRQLQATQNTIGEPKVFALEKRLREINPCAKINAVHNVYNRDTKDEFALDKYDYVIDAIDSLTNKVELIVNAHDSGATLFSSLGAARKIDPTMTKVSSIWKTDKCKLGRFVRKRLRRRKFAGDFICVWSDESVYNLSDNFVDVDNDELICDNVNNDVNNVNNVNHNDNDNDNGNDNVEVENIKGSLVYVTGVFGFTLTSLVVNDVVKKSNEKIMQGENKI